MSWPLETNCDQGAVLGLKALHGVEEEADHPIRTLAHLLDLLAMSWNEARIETL